MNSAKNNKKLIQNFVKYFNLEENITSDNIDEFLEFLSANKKRGRPKSEVKCNYVYKKGDHKGKKCENGTLTNSSYCHIHKNVFISKNHTKTIQYLSHKISLSDICKTIESDSESE